VNLLSIRSTLLKFGVPEAIADYLVEVNRHAIPKFQGVDLVDESRLRLRKSWSEFSDQFVYRGEQVSAVTGSPDDAASDVEADLFQGVGQGTATGPFLAALALENSLFTTKNGCVQYADDGVFFGDGLDLTFRNDKAGTDEDPWRGVQFHPTKSGWVKRDGVWLKPLKFLGLVYDGLSGTLYSDTRSGKRLFFDKDQLLTELSRGELSVAGGSAQPTDRRASFEKLVLSRFWGFVQSRLYSGS
jgi:hypothetical protein